MRPNFGNAGEFVFMQTTPAPVIVVRFEAFAFKVSASGGPPGGQSVVLKCEVSEVSGDPVTLAWLRMEGRRGLLVKQDVLTESHPNRTLSVTLPSLHSDQLYWQCGVFIEGMLRASVPLRLRGAGGRSGLPGLGLPSPLKDYTQQTLIIATCTALVVAGILIGSLVFYLKRKKTDPVSTVPPSGVSIMNHLVVLRREVLEVSGDPVTLARLRMKGRRGRLVKQDVLTESHPNRTLSVKPPQASFTGSVWCSEGLLRATASLTSQCPHRQQCLQ
ncbi:hypothetical protein J4Q44_G00149000 [Coregonus suidteri]|uniref:Ig-like domain-containing protein n=1 Tax=Coregonus suidteri TaxID=861788 RepID=A0AAN8M218_9TELE